MPVVGHSLQRLAPWERFCSAGWQACSLQAPVRLTAGQQWTCQASPAGQRVPVHHCPSEQGAPFMEGVHADVLPHEAVEASLSFKMPAYTSCLVWIANTHIIF